MMRSLPVALVAFSAAGALLSAPSHTITGTDIANIRKVSDCQISPDGKQVAWVLETPVKAGEQRNAHIWVSSAPGHAFLSSAKSDTEPRWSPDGKTLAFLSDRAPATPPAKPEEQIWAISLSGGEAYPLTTVPGGVKSFKWSKDGKQLGFIRTDPDSPSEKARKEAKYDQIVVHRNYQFDRLWTYTIATGATRQITTDDVNVDDFDWSPDSSQVLARLSPTPVLNDYWYRSSVVLLDVATGHITRTLTDQASPQDIRWAETGTTVSYGLKTARGIADIPVLHNLATDQKVLVGKDLPVTLRDLLWDGDGRNLTVQGVEGTRSFFAKVSAETGKLTRLADVPSNGYSFTVSRDGRTIAYVGNTPDRPDDVWTYTIGAGPKSLGNANPQVQDWKLGKVTEISWKSSNDGHLIYGVLTLPPDYQPGHPHKTIVHAHGGPFEAWLSGWLGTWYEWSQLLASNGYVVLAPNPRGSQGQGSAFQEANYADWGGGDYQDVLDGVDKLVKDGVSDPDHVGIGGWSYGGFMTSWTITHTDRFKAAVVGAAVTDLVGMSTTTDIAPSFLDEFFGSFIANRKLYEDHSPMRFIDRCHTPTLVLHGDADVRVPTFQGQEIYKALQLLGRPVEFVRYPREPHIFAEREHQIDMLDHLVAFFNAHV